MVVNALRPESKSFPLFASLNPVPDITVCIVLSLLVHVTVSPPFTLIDFGENPFAGVIEAPAGIVTLAPLDCAAAEC